MSEVVTNLVIDADTSGADQYTQAMDKASASSQEGIGSAAGVTLAIAGVGAGFVAALAALHGFVDYVGNTNKELVDLATNATNAGMSTKEFQETLFAAMSNGVSDKDFTSGLDKIGTDLTAASMGATQFGKLFEENDLSIKNTNGDLKTTQQVLGDITNLIKNAPTPGVANAVASIVGLSRDWIPFLQQGVDQIEAQKKAASDLGIVIDDSTVQKAKDFNDQWHSAVAAWDMQFKASLAGILPLLIQLANIAATVITAVGSISGSMSALNTPDDQKSKKQLDDTADYVTALIDLQTKWGDSSTGIAGQRIQNLQSLLGIPEGSSINEALAYLDKLNALYDKPTKVLITGGSTGNGSTVLPQKDEANDAVDRAINTLQRHVDAQKADTEAIGLGDAALALAKATAAEHAAVVANDGQETAKQAASFLALKQAAYDAADALAKAKVSSNIDFGSKTALLSPEDVQIATQLKSIYGNDVTAALNSTYAAAMRLNDGVKELSTGIQNDLVTGLTNIADGSVKAGAGFQAMGLSIIKTIEQMIIKLLIVGPLMRGLQDSIFPSGAVNANGSISGAIGPTSVGGAPLVGLHSGGIVGSEATFSRYVSPAYFDDAPKFHSGGIAGDEVPIIAKRGEGVFTAGQMAAMGGGGGGAPIVNVYAAPNTQTEARTSKNSNGQTVIDLIHTTVDQKMASGGFDKTLGARFNLKPGVRPR